MIDDNTDQNSITIYFDAAVLFEVKNITPLRGMRGLYFIFGSNIKIQYPFGESKLLYIGMSEKKTNSISSRLIEHFDGKSKNAGLVNYRKIESLMFTYINFEILKDIWRYRVEDLESYFILDFVEKFGVYPICNNKSGYEILNKLSIMNFNIDWNYFNE